VYRKRIGRILKLDDSQEVVLSRKGLHLQQILDNIECTLRDNGEPVQLQDFWAKVCLSCKVFSDLYHRSSCTSGSPFSLP